MDADRNRLTVASWDVASGDLDFVSADGRTAHASLPSRPADATSQISRVLLFPDSFVLGLTTVRNDAVSVLLPFKNGVESASAPTVYLDQNHWSSIAKLSYAPERIKTAQEARSASQVKEMAMNGSIVLPLSMAHLGETLKWHAIDSRYQHGLAMLQLSRGWQFRHPLEIRKEELAASFASCFEHRQFPRRSAVTLLPDAMYHLRDYVNLSQSYPADIDDAFRLHCMTAAVVLADLLLDSAPVEDSETVGWTARMQEFHNWLHQQDLSKKKRNDAIDAFFFSDIVKEISIGAALVNATKVELEEWVTERRVHELAKCPALALFRELIRDKFSNRQAHWEDNDLEDLLYLSCAASYVDYVVCESATAGLLRQAQRRIGEKATVYRDLGQFVRGATIDPSCQSYGL